jgi:hypothetical protein
MPRGDGTGPNGTGPRGEGRCVGSGAGSRQSGFGRGGRSGAGPGEYCVCSTCGEKMPHQMGMPCYEQKCPKCGAVMARA